MARPTPAGADTPVAAPVAVWNHGFCACTNAQSCHLARLQRQVLRPDVLVVQIYNAGRRPWLTPKSAGGQTWSRVLADADTTLENFAAPLLLPEALHLGLLRHSALYRATAAAGRVLWYGPTEANLSDHADTVHAPAEVAALLKDARAAGIPVVFLRVPQDERWHTAAEVAASLPEAHLWRLPESRCEKDGDRVHPSPAVLTEWGEWVAAKLVETGTVH